MDIYRTACLVQAFVLYIPYINRLKKWDEIGTKIYPKTYNRVSGFCVNTVFFSYI